MKKSVIAFFTLLIATKTFSQTNQPGCYSFPKTISVTGSAELNIIPDEIYVQVTLTEYKKKGEAKKELEQIKSEFLASCRAVGVADSNISVASFDGYNMSSLWRRRRKDPDLLSSIVYQLKFSNTKLIDALADKLDDASTSSFGITRLSHSKVAEYRRQLKIQAVKAAREKAQYLAESVNEQLGQAITITEPNEYLDSDVATGKSKYSPVNSTMNFSKFYDSDNNAVDVDYRKINIRYEVTTVYALK